MKKLLKKILKNKQNSNQSHFLVMIYSFLYLVIVKCIYVMKRYSITHHSKKIMYLNIPKSACSAIKVSLFPPALVEEVEKAKINNTLNVDKIIINSQKKYSHIIEIINMNPKIAYNEYFIFSFVRNPFTRILSCYIDKCLKANFHFTNYLFGVLSNVKNFDEFIRKICTIPNFLSDAHFRSQFSYLYNFRKL